MRICRPTPFLIVAFLFPFFGRIRFVGRARWRREAWCFEARAKDNPTALQRTGMRGGEERGVGVPSSQGNLPRLKSHCVGRLPWHFPRACRARATHSGCYASPVSSTVTGRSSRQRGSIQSLSARLGKAERSGKVTENSPRSYGANLNPMPTRRKPT
ncbi:hypothetical protein B0T19DRAFT_95069 [Cercophora scortea]|uniref:Uncharacterized protein n=1 Tax=Cercophora scortea TaxID=314031 RepID=A0AAE0IW87_9PEZI|nr:hypothetical protein B0T19DRAFT_95069 [Cercophora scortea]